MNEKQRKARAYLRSYRVIVAQAEKCLEDYERAYDRAHKVTATLGECPGGGPSSDKVSEGAVEMLRHADELKVEHDRLTGLYRRRNEVIEAVAERNQLWGEVLSMVHVEGMKVSDVRRFTTGRWKRHTTRRFRWGSGSRTVWPTAPRSSRLAKPMRCSDLVVQSDDEDNFDFKSSVA